MRRSSINSSTSSVMVRRPMTEGVAAETSISAERVGVGKGSATGELVTKLGSANEGDKREDGERGNGVDGAEGVSSGKGLSETEKEVPPSAIRRDANKGEVLGERPARLIVRRNAGIRRLNK